MIWYDITYLLIRCKNIWWAMIRCLKMSAGHITWRILWLRCNIPECDCFACKNLKRSTTNRYSSITLKLEQLLEINLPRWQTQVEWTSCSPVLLSTAGQEEAAHARNCARIFRNKITLHGCTKCNKIVMLQNQVIHNAPFPSLTLLWEFLLEWNLGVSLF